MCGGQRLWASHPAPASCQPPHGGAPILTDIPAADLLLTHTWLFLQCLPPARSAAPGRLLVRALPKPRPPPTALPWTAIQPHPHLLSPPSPFKAAHHRTQQPSNSIMTFVKKSTSLPQPTLADVVITDHRVTVALLNKFEEVGAGGSAWGLYWATVSLLHGFDEGG